MTDAVARHADRFVAALVYPLTTGTRTLLSGLIAVVTYGLLILSAFPTYTIQMLQTDLGYLDETVFALTANTYATAGWFGVSLVVVYAVLTGVAVVVAGAQIRTQGVQRAGGLTGVLPGVLAAGCASCGAGVLGLLGVAGVVALMPFHGNLLRGLGILVLVGYLSRTGDPTTCAIETE
ncbi:hypothetical protein [Salinibaculum salinum]|uniref:hypothetical protein n=1 Tax=Salinibaculum salinum TaxID=3131996 RepID=UPI0030EF9602